MRKQLRTTWDRLHSSYWFVPTLMALSATFLAFSMVRFDQSYRDEVVEKLGWIYSGGPEGARAVLSTIAGSIITVAGTTFSITIAVLSLASAQYGPRLLRSFMRDTGNQVVLGAFTSTFLYCLLVLRTVRGQEDNVYVPHFSVTIAVALALINLGVLIYFIHHIADSIQVGQVIEVVSGELQSAVTRLFPERIAEPSHDHVSIGPLPHELIANCEGYLQSVDESALVRYASQEDLVAELLARPGDYLVPKMPLLATSKPLSTDQKKYLRGVITVGRSRTPHQDALFAFEQLAEIALRALSPSVNDPFTAIMCIDRINSAVLRLGERTLPQSVRCDAAGVPRIIAHPYSYDDLIAAAYRHIREAAEGHRQVTRHLRQSLEYVLARTHISPLREALAKEKIALGP
jgi:uncharacterized membrane protein